jgi:hypothetical protein
VRQAIDKAQMALHQEDLETARTALESARQNLQQTSGQGAGGAQQQQLEEVDRQIQEALAALDQDDVQTAQQALEDAKVPMQEATQQEASQQQRTPPQAQEGPGDAGTTETAATEPPQPAGQQAAGQERADSSPLAEIPASELLGQDVVNEEGDTVAEIVDMVKRGDSEEVFAVLSVGGFLGLGDKKVAMPLDRFDVGQDQQIVLTGLAEDEIENMPAYEDDGSFQSVGQ